MNINKLWHIQVIKFRLLPYFFHRQVAILNKNTFGISNTQLWQLQGYQRWCWENYWLGEYITTASWNFFQACSVFSSRFLASVWWFCWYSLCKIFATLLRIFFNPSFFEQDFTGVPAVVDLACMQDAMMKLGGDPNKINPLVCTFLWHTLEFPVLTGILSFIQMICSHFMFRNMIFHKESTSWISCNQNYLMNWENVIR